MQNSMAVTTATDARRVTGVPILLKWFSSCALNPDTCALSQPNPLLRLLFQTSTKGDRHESPRRFCEGVAAESPAGPAADVELCQQLWA
jgi:hypothetical protein